MLWGVLIKVFQARLFFFKMLALRGHPYFLRFCCPHFPKAQRCRGADYFSVKGDQEPLHNAPFLNGLFPSRFFKRETAHEGIRGDSPLRRKTAH